MSEQIWAAGFFDGEGCTSLTKVRGRNYPRVRIGQTEPTTLQRFRLAVGCGHILGPYYSNHPNQKPLWMYQVSSLSEVIQVLDAMWPHLSTPKKRQAARIWQECFRVSKT